MFSQDGNNVVPRHFEPTFRVLYNTIVISQQNYIKEKIHPHEIPRKFIVVHTNLELEIWHGMGNAVTHTSSLSLIIRINMSSRK